MPRNYWDWATRLEPESYRWFCGTAPEHLLFALREALDCGRPTVVDVVTSFEPNFRDVTSPLTQG